MLIQSLEQKTKLALATVIMLIQSLEQKTKLALATVILTLTACTAICIFTVYQSSKLVSEERSQIYILDGDIPFLAERSLQEANFVMEAKAHIQLFHQYFSAR